MQNAYLADPQILKSGTIKPFQPIYTPLASAPNFMLYSTGENKFKLDIFSLKNKGSINILFLLMQKVSTPAFTLWTILCNRPQRQTMKICFDTINLCLIVKWRWRWIYTAYIMNLIGPSEIMPNFNSKNCITCIIRH